MNIGSTTMGLENLFPNGFNSIFFSLAAMGIVFFGLVVISFYIALLPKVLRLIYKEKVNKAPVITDALALSEISNDEIVAAITTALRLEAQDADREHKITWDITKNSSEWKQTGLQQNLSQRQSLPLRRS